MRLLFSKSFTAGLAAAFLSVASASAAVPSLERQGRPAPTALAVEGVQLAIGCGNWQPNAYNRSDACADVSAGADPDWVKRGDGGSQDRSFEAQRSVSSSQESKVENEADNDPPFPCLC